MDDNFMYFTSTGNWSDTKDLGEFNEEYTKKSSSAERFKTITYLGFAGVLVVCLLWTLGIGSFSFASIIGLAWLGYSAYHYMAPGLTGEFKIPYPKVRSIKIKSSSVTIVFKDFNNDDTTQEINKLNHEACHLFAQICDRYQLPPKTVESSDSEKWEV